MRCNQLLLAALFVPLAGCATLFARNSGQVTRESDTPGADVYIGGVWRGHTPFTLAVENNTKPLTVTFRQAGRQDLSVELHPKARPDSLTLDIVGGKVPVLLDPATGEWKVLPARERHANGIVR
jgi:hypothetical protein